MDRAPVFVKIDEYKDITDVMALMREKVSHAKILLQKISELKAQEDAELSTWTSELSDIESKIAEIDHMLFQPSI